MIADSFQREGFKTIHSIDETIWPESVNRLSNNLAQGSSTSNCLEPVVFIQLPITTTELVMSPVCVHLSEIVQIPKASLFLDQWDWLSRQLALSMLLVARSAMLFLVFTQLQRTSAPRSSTFSEITISYSFTNWWQKKLLSHMKLLSVKNAMF